MWEILCDGLMKPRLNFLAIILKGMFGAKTTLRITKGTPYPQWSMMWQHHALGLFFFSWNWGRSVHSKRVTLPSEGHFGVKTIMAAILKCPSKPKCSKLTTSKGPSKWRISKGTTDGHCRPHDPLHWFFAWWRRLRMMTQKDTSRNSCLVPYNLQPFEALTPEGKPFEGIRA